MNLGTMLLTSIGLSADSVVQKIKELVPDPENRAVAIVTTAAEGKDENKYSRLAKAQFDGLGFSRVVFVDLETERREDFSNYDVIYVCGGNTFKLLKFAREANFKVSVEGLLARGGVYVGVSAGSILVGPSIEIAGTVAGDVNGVGLNDLTGLGLTDLVILPHYSPEVEDGVAAFEEEHGVKVERISNSQAVLVGGGNKLVFGQ
jgi:dipeptidase E